MHTTRGYFISLKGTRIGEKHLKKDMTDACVTVTLSSSYDNTWRISILLSRIFMFLWTFLGFLKEAS